MNIFLRILLRNLAMGAVAVTAAILWLTFLIFITAIFAHFLPAALAAFLFVAMLIGSIVIVAFTFIELSDRRLLDFSDVNKFFGIPEKEKPKFRL